MAVTRKAWTAVFSIIAAVFVTFLAASFFVHWSPINCWHYDVDIRSGRIRYTRYLLWSKVYESIEETPLSQAVSADFPSAEPDWHPMRTESPGVGYSPNFVFGFAECDVCELSNAWEIGRLSRRARLVTSRRVIEQWNLGESANEYLSHLTSLALTNALAKESTSDQEVVDFTNSFAMPCVQE